MVAAMMTSRPEMQVGMAVMGSDSKPVGKVKEVRDSDFLLDRKLARDLYVPFDAVSSVDAGQVVLSLKAEDVLYQRWLSPPLFGR
jgi:hypothetical protein